jgi:putative transposase
MKKARFTESQIISILSKQDKEITVADICHEHGISNATFFNLIGKGSMEE